MNSCATIDNLSRALKFTLIHSLQTFQSVHTSKRCIDKTNIQLIKLLLPPHPSKPLKTQAYCIYAKQIIIHLYHNFPSNEEFKKTSNKAQTKQNFLIQVQRKDKLIEKKPN